MESSSDESSSDESDFELEIVKASKSVFKVRAKSICKKDKKKKKHGKKAKRD